MLLHLKNHKAVVRPVLKIALRPFQNATTGEIERTCYMLKHIKLLLSILSDCNCQLLLEILLETPAINYSCICQIQC